jgi:hypothetical protein
LQADAVGDDRAGRECAGYRQRDHTSLERPRLHRFLHVQIGAGSETPRATCNIGAKT